MKRSPLLAALVIIGFAGCGEGISPVVESRAKPTMPTPTTVRERLEAEPKEFRAMPALTSGELVTRRVLADVSSAVSLGVADGRMELQARNNAQGAHMSVSRFEVALRDVKLTPAQLPPNGLTFTQVRLVMTEPATLHVRWYGDGELGFASGQLPVELQVWVLMSTGAISPMEHAQFTVPIELMVSEDEHHVLGMSLDVSHAGALWSWSNLFELKDLKLNVGALEVTPLDQLPPRQVVQDTPN